MDGSGREGFAYENGIIVIVLDDVDLLYTSQALCHGLDAYAFLSHACANRINAALGRKYSDFCPLSRFAHHFFDLHSPLGNLGDFFLEKLRDQKWSASRKDNSEVSKRVLSYFFDEEGVGRIEGVFFVFDLFFIWHDALCLANINRNDGSFKLDDASFHERTYKGLVVFGHGFFLRLSDFLEDDLTGSLGRNAAKSRGRHVFFV